MVSNNVGQCQAYFINQVPIFARVMSGSARPTLLSSDIRRAGIARQYDLYVLLIT